jgi:hypothetical protein
LLFGLELGLFLGFSSLALLLELEFFLAVGCKLGLFGGFFLLFFKFGGFALGL